MFDSIKNSLNNAYAGVVKTIKAPPKEDQFKINGMLSPEEFVKAGDNLIQLSPVWAWKSAPDPANASQYLPKDKQYLILEDVPSYERLIDLANKAKLFNEVENEDGFMVQEGMEKQKKEEKQEQKLDEEQKQQEPEIIQTEPEVRIYRIVVSYDEFYYCPRLFLSAVVQSDNPDLNGNPVPTNSIFDDIVGEKVNTTVTVEKHPILKEDMATVHPCKHSKVLKDFVERISEGRSDESIGSHLAIILFLKFFHDVIPTIDMDTNFNIDFGESEK